MVIEIAILVFIIVTGCLSGFIFVRKGLRKFKQGDRSFNFRDLFRDLSFNESSGALLIIEGFIVFAGIIGFCYLLARLLWY